METNFYYSNFVYKSNWSSNFTNVLASRLVQSCDISCPLGKVIKTPVKIMTVATYTLYWTNKAVYRRSA